jgi:hypothetical protein
MPSLRDERIAQLDVATKALLESAGQHLRFASSERVRAEYLAQAEILKAVLGVVLPHADDAQNERDRELWLRSAQFNLKQVRLAITRLEESA